MIAVMILKSLNTISALTAAIMLEKLAFRPLALALPVKIWPIQSVNMLKWTAWPK